jgi:hypothetical protein
MDHLPHPANSSPVEVPFLPHTPDYGLLGVNHVVFPDDHNYQVGATYERASQDIASFAQSFLFFGLLSDVLRRTIEPSLLTDTSRADINGYPTISMQKLKYLVMSAQIDDDAGERIGRLLDQASHHLIILDRIGSPTGYPLPQVLVSIGVLIHTLGALMLSEYNPPSPLSYGDNKETMTVSAKWFLVDMIRRGWCSSQTHQVLCLFPYGSAYYLSLILRHSRKVNEHKDCKPDGCTAYKIEEGEYHPAHTSDCADQSICKTLTIPAEASKLILQGKIPLVYIDRSKEGNSISIKVKELEPKDRYIAISHVWSDGRGNENENGLPQCQICRLSEYVSGAPRTPPLEEFSSALFGGDFTPMKLFWMDTLCIPQDKALKALAINSIPAVYAGAVQVLVLDVEIEQVRLEGSQWPEVAGKLVLSAWSGRSWTLEEAGFSRDCYAKVADGYFRPLASTTPSNKLYGLARRHIQDLLKPGQDRSLSRDFDSAMMEMVSEPMSKALGEMFTRGSQRSGVGPEDDDIQEICQMRLFSTWNGLTTRQTTVEADELTIFIHLLELNPFEVMDAPSARPQNHRKLGNDLEARLPVSGAAGKEAEGQRPVDGASPPRAEQDRAALTMKRALMSLDTLPLDLLCQDGPRFRADEDHDYRWLPLCPSKNRIRLHGPMSWIPDGLELLAIDEAKSQPQMYLVKLDKKIRSANSMIIDLQHEKRGRGHSPLGGSKWMAEFLREPNDGLDRAKYSAAAIIFNPVDEKTYKVQQHRGAFVLVSKVGQDCSCQGFPPLGIFVNHSCGRERPQIRLECTYDCPVRVRHVTDGTGYLDDDFGGSTQSDDIHPFHIKCWRMTLKCGLSNGLSLLEFFD